MRKDTINWIALAEYDLETAQHMLTTGRFLYVVFMCHLSLEKMLKAHVTETTKSIPVKTHDLIYLIKPLVLVLEAEGSKRKMDIATIIHLNTIPFNQNVEHCHRKRETALEISPFSVHNLLEVINQCQHG